MQPRYSRLNQSLHWITVLLMFTVLPLAWVMVNTKGGTPLSTALFNWHKTLGALVLIVTAFRIVWRFFDPPPAYPPVVAAWEQGVARAIYWLFFAVLLWMPITGFVSTIYSGHPTKLFNAWPTPQLLPPDRGLAGLFTELHLIGQFAVYILIGLHLCAIAMHLIWRHDGVLGRMLPQNATEPAPQPQPQPPRPAQSGGLTAARR